MLYSAGGSGNGANYALAGKAAVATTNKAFRVARENCT